MMTLIFDVDGTLAETERYGHRVAFNRAFAEAGLNWFWSESLYGELLEISGGKERIRYYMTHYLPDAISPEETLIQDLHSAKNRYYRQVLGEGGIPLRPGVKRLITEAYEAGIPCAIATTSALENTVALLETHLGTTAYFRAIAAGDVVADKKPAPDIYHYVLQQLNVMAADALVFEDSQPGLTAATQAGLKTVVTVNDYTAHQDFSNAILVISDLGEPNQPFTIYSDQNSLDQTYFNLDLAQRLLQFH
ncbi:HAD-superfamily hydrolase, subfamily IA, variant 3 [Halothece sp. PCC 7418]|uniref:HAD-IA family hydrolase n=1 Tax=Halothece sp. (strain PCC 7418) TaxID=65093 RepID=UPI0002A060E6|nr:HAD-superfamily hydrolase, subfamily IA, variant 3 [Halothece sp. PCC 7418]